MRWVLRRLAPASVAWALAAGSLAAGTPTAETLPPATDIRLVDVAAERGLRFVHDIGRPEVRYAVETTGSGCCVLDADGDGDGDVFLVNGGVLREDGGGEAPARRSPSRLYLNEGGRFRPAGPEAGLDGSGWGMGCAVADVDGDGDEDLFVTGLGADQLYLNDGAGRFRDVASRAGLADPRWTTSAGFADHDRDGDLDLYVGAYVAFAADGKRCPGPGGLDVTCGPRDYDGTPGRLYRNDGVGPDGVPRFTDVTTQAGAVEPVGKTLGVLFEDLTDDGWPDIYLANDTVRNTLLVNRGDGTFVDRTARGGVGLSDVGLAEAGMGVDAGDLDGDGRTDLVVTNFHLETNTLYRGVRDGLWMDVSDSSGLGMASLTRLGFGLNLADFDLDGDLDAFVANGHVEPRVATFDTATSHAQDDQVMENFTGSGARGGRVTLRDVSATAVRAPRVVSRGSAVLDFDADGDLDVVVTANGGAAGLLENRSARSGRHWLALRLVGPPPNTRAVGASVRARSGGRVQVRRVRTASSFLSTSSLDLHFGLGDAAGADVEVTWPDGRVQELGRLAADRLHVVRHPGRRDGPASEGAAGRAP